MRPWSPARPPRLVPAVLAAAVALGVITAPGAAAQPAPPAPAPAPAAPAPAAPDWQPCAEDPTAECGAVTVPLDHRDPAKGTLDVAVARRAATDPAQRIGVLVLNPGGPGGSGVDQMLTEELPPELTARFDVVGFDPRGVARTSPVECWTTEEYLAAYAAATTRPRRAAVEQAVSGGRAIADACAARSAELVPYLGTEYVARDIDLIRAALGEERISFLGLSYGTYIGTVFANLFPHRLRAAVLDGAYDPDAYANRPYTYDRTQFRAAGAALERFLDWCSAAPDECGFGAGDARGAYDRLLRDLDRPVAPGEVNAVSLSYVVLFVLNGGRAGWRQLGGLLAGLTAPGAEGTVARTQLLGFLESIVGFFPANTAVECADRVYPRSGLLLRARLVLHSDVLGGRLGPPIGYAPPGYDHSHAPACVAWRAERASRYAGPFDAPSAPPILVVGTTGDPDTPYVDAVALSRTLKTARLLTFEAEGHTAFSRSACAQAAAVAYLLDGTLPAEGTRCADEQVPPPT